MTSTLSFRLNFCLLVLAILLVAAGGALGMVTLRIQIEDTAQAVKALEVEIADMERLDRFLDARIAHVHQPRELVKMVADRGLEMRAPSPRQFVHVRETLPDILFTESPRIADLRYRSKDGNANAYASTYNR